MNANQAVKVNEQMTNELFEAAKEMATRLNMTISKAIDKKVSVHQKYAKSNNEAVAWDVRGVNAKKLINQ